MGGVDLTEKVGPWGGPLCSRVVCREGLGESLVWAAGKVC